MTTVSAALEALDDLAYTADARGRSDVRTTCVLTLRWLHDGDVTLDYAWAIADGARLALATDDDVPSFPLAAAVDPPRVWRGLHVALFMIACAVLMIGGMLALSAIFSSSGLAILGGVLWGWTLSAIGMAYWERVIR